MNLLISFEHWSKFFIVSKVVSKYQRWKVKSQIVYPLVLRYHQWNESTIVYFFLICFSHLSYYLKAPIKRMWMNRHGNILLFARWLHVILLEQSFIIPYYIVLGCCSKVQLGSYANVSRNVEWIFALSNLSLIVVSYFLHIAVIGR